jgi:hypothetical protein
MFMASLEHVVKTWVGSLGPQLVSVIRHGEPEPLQLMVVLTEVRSKALTILATEMRKAGLRADLVFFTPSELADSRDVFPLELLDAQSSYEVLHGQDVLADLTVPPSELRLQIEEDLKTQRTWLRQRFLDYSQDPKKVDRLPYHAFATLPPVLRGMLRYKNVRVPSTREGQLQAAAETFGLDASLLNQLQRGNGGVHVDRYADLLDQLIAAVENS